MMPIRSITAILEHKEGGGGGGGGGGGDLERGGTSRKGDSIRG